MLYMRACVCWCAFANVPVHRTSSLVLDVWQQWAPRLVKSLELRGRRVCHEHSKVLLARPLLLVVIVLVKLGRGELSDCRVMSRAVWKDSMVRTVDIRVKGNMYSDL